MKDADQIARGIAECWHEEDPEQEHVKENIKALAKLIATALREYGEVKYQQGRDISLLEDRKRIDAEGYRRGVEENAEVDRICRYLLRVIDRVTYVTDDKQTPILGLLRMHGVKLYKALQRGTGGGE